MRKPLIIGNWKSHKSRSAVKEWFDEIAAHLVGHGAAEIVLCPSFPLLDSCQQSLKAHGLPWKLGVQDISMFGEGKHTGEVNASQVKDLATFVLVGHSERRTELHESNDMLSEKVKRALEAGLQPIFFVQDKETPIPPNVSIVAYEPVFAIGTGSPDNPENVESVAYFLKHEKKIPTVLYGGSVDNTNVGVFLTCQSIDGVVPGTASLDPIIFSKLIQNA